MRDTAQEELQKKRLNELARRALVKGTACFTEFLTPPEAEWARRAARAQGVTIALYGGYDDAERQVARFDGEGEPFPVETLLIEWPRQTAPTHRDLLGGVMGLGFRRSLIGDIALEAERAYLFAISTVAGSLAESFTEAGRAKLRVSVSDEPPTLAPIEGTPVRDTVSSPRLDAVLSGGFGLSRAAAAELIATGRVKLRHMPTVRPDAHVAEGDAISLRGYGRLVLEEIGSPTKKGRIPIRLIRYGERRGR